MAAKAKASGKSLAEFSAAYNKDEIVPKKIRDGLKQLGNGWEYELDFMRRCSISQTDMGRFRPEFEDDFVVNTGGKNPKRVWAGTKELADQMREMI